jgi:hypothetical protein
MPNTIGEFMLPFATELGTSSPYLAATYSFSTKLLCRAAFTRQLADFSWDTSFAQGYLDVSWGAFASNPPSPLDKFMMRVHLAGALNQQWNIIPPPVVPNKPLQPLSPMHIDVSYVSNAFAGKPLLPEYDSIKLSDDATGDSTELHNNNMEYSNPFDPAHSQGHCFGSHDRDPNDFVWLQFETQSPVLVSIDQIIDWMKMSGGAGSGQS